MILEVKVVNVNEKNVIECVLKIHIFFLNVSDEVFISAIACNDITDDFRSIIVKIITTSVEDEQDEQSVIFIHIA